MMRILFILLICLAASFLFLQGRLSERTGELPVFLNTDTIALKHKTKINILVKSMVRPDSSLLLTLKNDYSNIWAHLNYLYSTNNVEAGKEYYTEDWFKQITSNYEWPVTMPLKRIDEEHNLTIENWADDALVCTVTDSNIVFKYSYADGSSKIKKTTAAAVLLYQGDHWRMDALRIINEETITAQNFSPHN